jgi:DNA-binding CsgD family transcriptional regulator
MDIMTSQLTKASATPSPLSPPRASAGAGMLPSLHSNREKTTVMKSDACLILVNVPRCRWCFPLTEKQQTIGRSPESSIEIPHYYRSVSRQHASAWYHRGSFRICDVGSSCGTRVNGIWLKANEPATIVVGDRLTLGSAELRLIPFARKRDDNAPAKTSDKTAIFRTPEPLLARLRLQSLTLCEHNIVLWMARGYIHENDLGQILHRSPNTIRTQIASILKKLEIHSRMSILNELMKEGATLRVHEQVDNSV